MFSLICARINAWVNNREAGDFIRHRAHCDVIVINPRIFHDQGIEIIPMMSHERGWYKIGGPTGKLICCGLIRQGKCDLLTLQLRHNERDGVSNHRNLDRLLNRLFRRRSKKHYRFRVSDHCEELDDRWFPSQRASNAENVFIWWRLM